MNKILEKLFDSFVGGLKKTAVVMVLKAESDLPGASGAEKRAWVVDKIDSLISLPWYLEALDGPAIGVLVDLICNKLNLLTDHEKVLVAGVEEKAVVVLEATDEELTEKGKSVDEKLDSLCAKYNIK